MSDSEIIQQCKQIIISAWFGDTNAAIEILNNNDDVYDEDFFEKHPILGLLLSWSVHKHKILILFAIIFFGWFIIWFISSLWETFWFLVNGFSEML